MDNILIQFHGMGYRRSEQLESWLESLMRHSPSESTCRMHIFKDPHGYLCKLTVHSTRKTFSAQFKDQSMVAALQYVLNSVKKQVAKWKKNRSTSELTGVVSITKLEWEHLKEKSKPFMVREDGGLGEMSEDGDLKQKKVA